MFEVNDRGRAVRRYFIACEREFRRTATVVADAEVTRRLEGLESRLRSEFARVRNEDAAAGDGAMTELQARMNVVTTENDVLRAEVALRDAQARHAEACAAYGDAEASGIFTGSARSSGVPASSSSPRRGARPPWARSLQRRNCPTW